jgi:uncharacterized protein
VKDTQDIRERLINMDWRTLTEDMHAKGYAHVPDLLTQERCKQLIADYDSPNLYRKTITMERYRFGVDGMAAD